MKFLDIDVCLQQVELYKQIGLICYIRIRPTILSLILTKSGSSSFYFCYVHNEIFQTLKLQLVSS